MIRDAWLIGRVEFLRRLRNRSALFTAFVGPLVLAVVFGVIIGGTASVSISIGVVDLDKSELTSGFTGALIEGTPTEGDAPETDSPVSFEVIEAETADQARASVDDGDVDAIIVIPEGFGAAAMRGQAPHLEVLRDPARQVAGTVAASIAREFAAGVSTRILTMATAASLGASIDPADLGLKPGSSGDVRTEEPGGSPLDATAFYGVAMSILFLFFTASFAARSLIAEGKSGLIGRMLAASTAPASIMAGKVMAVAALGMSGFITVWLVTSVVFGADWGRPIAVVVTMTATVAAVAGVSMFVCGFARTEQQADGYASITAFALALLGGNFVGPGQAPDALEQIATLTPNGQAFNAFTRISADSAGVTDVFAHLAALAGFAIVFGAIGLVRVRRVIIS
jgi:ABC-2 type transport system permease protein